LIKNTDHFILLDEVQFIRHGWIERNRMLKENDSWLYIQVPVKKNQGRSTLIKNIEVNNFLPWKEKIFSQIRHYKKIAPNFSGVFSLMQGILDEEYKGITTLNKVALEGVCQHLGFFPKVSVFSQMGLEIENPEAPDEWALNICKALGNVTEYWNPPGGKSFFDQTKYEKEDIQLVFQKINLSSYDQKREEFIPGLSILDVLMFNSKEKVLEMLNEYELE
jgi:hypothetical protein